MDITHVDAAISLPTAAAKELFAELKSNPSLSPDLIDSAGAEGGGAISTILISFSKTAIGYVAGLISARLGNRELKVQIGETSLHAAQFPQDVGEIEKMLDKVLEMELKRLRASPSKGA